MQQEHFSPTVGLLSSDEFLDVNFPRIAAMFPMILGHVDALPEKGSYYVPPHAGGRIYLMRGKDGDIRAFLNVCPHRNGQLGPVGSVINDVEFPRQGMAAPKREGMEVRSDVIVCPWHLKTFDHLGEARNHECGNLKEVPLDIIGGFIFEAGKGALTQLASLRRSAAFLEYKLSPLAEDIRLKLCKSLVCDEPYTATTGMAIFGDDDHVNKIHLRTFNFMVSMRSLRVEKGRDWSAQFVDWGGLGNEASPEYKNYMDMVLARCEGMPPKIGAVWLAYGANVTLEWYQCGPDPQQDLILVVSTYIPKGRRTDIAIEVYAADPVPHDLVEAFWAAYMKTAEEDRLLCMSVDEGQRTLTLAGHGSDAVGPTRGLVEECVGHYYALLGRCLEATNNEPKVFPLKAA